MVSHEAPAKAIPVPSHGAKDGFSNGGLYPNKQLARNVYRRLVTITGNRKASYAFKCEFIKQISNRGLEGAITLLKAAGDGIIWCLTDIPRSQKPPWIRFSVNYKSRQLPRLFEMFRSCTPRQLLRISRVARSVRLPAITPKQLSKRLNPILEPLQVIDEDLALSLIIEGLEAASIHAGPVPTWEISNLPSVCRQVRTHTSVSGSVPIADDAIVSSLLVRKAHPILKTVPVDDCFHPLTKEGVELLSDQITGLEKSDSGFIGNVYCAQEGAGKLRVFAAPHVLFQSILTPIHKHIRKFLDKLPENCILNQLQGITTVQSWLAKGYTVSSIDETAATCRFPLLLQMAVLKLFNVPQVFQDLYHYCARGEWKVSDNMVRAGFPEVIQWQAGQPLGTVPSMSLYALTVILLLYGIRRRLALRQGLSNIEFVRLGDDFATNSNELAAVYRYVCSKIGVRINEEKSFQSSMYAEFAGACILKDSFLRPGQWKPISFVNLLDYFQEFDGLSDSELKGFSLKAVEGVKFILWTKQLREAESLEQYQKFLKVNSLLQPNWYELQCNVFTKLFSQGLEDHLKLKGFIFPRGFDYYLDYESESSQFINYIQNRILQIDYGKGIRILRNWNLASRLRDDVQSGIYNQFHEFGIVLLHLIFNGDLDKVTVELRMLEDVIMTLLWSRPRGKTSKSKTYLQKVCKALSV